VVVVCALVNIAISLLRGSFVVMEPEVDVTLIDATLALTPRERLEQNDRMLRMIAELRDGFANAKPDDAARDTGVERR
jgi:hypothetical protein